MSGESHGAQGKPRRMLAGADEAVNDLLADTKNDLEFAVCRFAAGQKSHTFSEKPSKVLIEADVAAVCQTDEEGSCVTGHLDEPIVVQSG